MDYVSAHIHWKENYGGGEEDVLIKLSCGYNDGEDDNVFFFANGVEELKSLMKEDNGEDFYISDYHFINK